MKKVWLLYDEKDLNVNRDYVSGMKERGVKYGLSLTAVLLDELTPVMTEKGFPKMLLNHEYVKPDAVISRMRDPLFSRHLEAMNVPVFNGSRVCEICNDKRYTLQFLKGLPMMGTRFVRSDKLGDFHFPQVVKPAASHGGDRVNLARFPSEYTQGLKSIFPEPALAQDVAKKAGFDLRVYVLFGKVVAGVMRKAKNGGLVSNFKLGGDVELHTLTRQESELVDEVIKRFENAGAPLCFAGIDFLYEEEGPVLSEVEDVVGSRMLYKASDIDIMSLYLEEISKRI